MLIFIIQSSVGFALLSVINIGKPPKLFIGRLFNLLSAIPGTISVTCSILPDYTFPPQLLIPVSASLLVAHIWLRVVKPRLYYVD